MRGIGVREAADLAADVRPPGHGCVEGGREPLLSNRPGGLYTLATTEEGRRGARAPAGVTRVLYCSPSQANAGAEVRGYMVEDCGIVEVGAYHARSRALR